MLRKHTKQKHSKKVPPKKGLSTHVVNKHEIPTPGIVNAPLNLMLNENVTECVKFFSNIRQQASEVLKSNHRKVFLNISNINAIDLPTTMVLNAIGRELAGRSVILQGNFPSNEECLDFFVKTGFLNDKVNATGMRFNKSENTEFFKPRLGQGKLCTTDTIKICNIVKHACDYLGRNDFYDDLVAIIKEIAGNSIEWSKSYKEQWTLGVMFDRDCVRFSILDLGKGILETVYRRFIKRITQVFSNDIEFLNDVFDKQYTSSSREENRYKGLPSIKKAFIDGKIENLYVMTNSVLLCFNNPTQSIQFSLSRNAFRGTLYYWEINKNK